MQKDTKQIILMDSIPVKLVESAHNIHKTAVASITKLETVFFPLSSNWQMN